MDRAPGSAPGRADGALRTGPRGLLGVLFEVDDSTSAGRSATGLSLSVRASGTYPCTSASARVRTLPAIARIEVRPSPTSGARLREPRAAASPRTIHDRQPARTGTPGW